MEYDWEVNNYVTTLDNEIYVNMVILTRTTLLAKWKINRKAPLELDQQRRDSYTAILQVPEGYNIERIPENQSFKSELLEL